MQNRAREMLEEGRLAAKCGDTSRAEVLWKQAQEEASRTEETFDCGGMFLASVYLAFLYQSWGRSHENSMLSAVQSALGAYHKAFQLQISNDDNIASPRPTVPVPESLSRILESLNDLCPNCYQPFLANEEVIDLSEENDVEQGEKLRYSRQKLLDISRELDTLSDPCTEAMLASFGYANISITVDVHPDNLLQPNRKKGGGKNASTKKKKKKHDSCAVLSGGGSSDCDTNALEVTTGAFTSQPSRVVASTNEAFIEKYEQEDSHLEAAHVSRSSSNTSSVRERPSFNSDQALAWANALDTNVKSLLGNACVLLTDDNANGSNWGVNSTNMDSMILNACSSNAKSAKSDGIINAHDSSATEDVL